MSKKLLIGLGTVALVTIIILAFVAFGGNEGVKGKLAIECLSSGSTGLACDLYHAHVAVEEANENLAEIQDAYDAFMAPTMEPTADLPP